MTFQADKPDLTVSELKKQMDAGKPPVILDVREPHEIAIAALPKTERTVQIPLGQLPARVGELNQYKGEEIVVYCRSGGRSQMAANFLQQNGFQARNLTGGVLAWSAEIDPSVPQY
jgi:sulfur-carrier protein adenylyltransferase/sulfurtransferase